MSLKSFYKQHPVYIVDGSRTPFLKAKAQRGEFSASDLAVQAGRHLLMRQPFSPAQLDEVIMGCVMPNENEANIARVISLRLGCGKTVPAWTVQRNCASGMQAIDSAAQDIAIGKSHLVLAGGAEAMSRAPLLYSPDMQNWMSEFYQARSLLQKLKILSHFKFPFLKPIIALMHGLSDPLVGLSMGQTAELLAYRFGITRTEMDQFSVRSHQRLAAAQRKADFNVQFAPLYSATGQVYLHDDGVRPDTNLELLSKLKSIFDKRFGLVTAGNSSQITDGAAMLLLASAKAVEKYNLPILGRIVDAEWAGLEPEAMGLGPVYAATPILQRNKLTLNDIDFWEINEAFAGQVLACLAAWEDKDFCKTELGLSNPLGKLDQDRLNIEGGAIALGHPIGASGARIILQLLQTLKNQGAKRGIATLCIGGGQGGAMLLETM